jgi:hypothetical protein
MQMQVSRCVVTTTALMVSHKSGDFVLSRWQAAHALFQ